MKKDMQSLIEGEEHRNQKRKTLTVARKEKNSEKKYYYFIYCVCYKGYKKEKIKSCWAAQSGKPKQYK